MCPNCNSDQCNLITNEVRDEPSVPDIEFRDIVFYCNACEITFNCVGSKKK